MSSLDLDKKVIVDVRTRPEYAEEHIPGSIHLPLHKISKYQEALSDKEVVFVCRTGQRATKAAQQIPRAQVLSGGIMEWKRTGNPIQGSAQQWSVQRQVRLVAGLLVVVGSVLATINTSWLLLTGFVGAGLVVAGAFDTCGMAKVLARMPWNSRSDQAITQQLSH